VPKLDDLVMAMSTLGIIMLLPMVCGRRRSFPVLIVKLQFCPTAIFVLRGLCIPLCLAISKVLECAKVVGELRFHFKCSSHQKYILMKILCISVVLCEMLMLVSASWRFALGLGLVLKFAHHLSFNASGHHCCTLWPYNLARSHHQPHLWCGCQWCIGGNEACAV
jgi:hypothetical protein